MSQHQPPQTPQTIQKQSSSPQQQEQTLSVRAIQTQLFKRGEN